MVSQHKYKSLHLTLDASISQSGKETVFYNMLAEFSSYWQRIDILCPRIVGATKRTIHQNVYIHPSPYHFLLQPWFVFKEGSRVIQEQKPDVIILHSGPPFLTDLGALLLHLRYRIPIIGEIMHIIGYPKAADFTERVFYWMTKWWWKFFQHFVKAIRVINHVDSLPKLVEWGIPRDKLYVIPANYIDHNIFKPINIPKKDNSLLFVGRLEQNKGIFQILKALVLIKKKIQNVHLTMIGSGSLQLRIEKMIADLQIQDNVTLIPFLKTQQDLIKYYNQARILVITSYNEGGPRVALEAMACKTVVASTPVGIINELIKDGENGIILNWDEQAIAHKLVKALVNIDKLTVMAKKGYESVAIYNYKESISILGKRYQQICADTK